MTDKEITNVDGVDLNDESDDGEGDDDIDYVETLIADMTLLGDIRLMLLGTPSALTALSANKGPCDVCDDLDHPTLSCPLLGEDSVLDSGLRIRLEQLMERLERQKQQLQQDEDGKDGATPSPQSKSINRNREGLKDASFGLEQQEGTTIDNSLVCERNEDDDHIYQKSSTSEDTKWLSLSDSNDNIFILGDGQNMKKRILAKQK